MNLQVFNAENVEVKRTGVPSIGVNQKTGLFNLNKFAVELMGLKNHDQICFHQDSDEPENWYVEKVKENGFVCRTKDNVTKGVLFNNVTLARMIGEANGIEGSYKMQLTAEPTIIERRKLYGIIFK